MPYAKIESSGCGIHKNRAKLRLDFFLSPKDPNYERYPDSPFHSHFIYPDKDASDADIKAEIKRCLNYFYAFHQYCWDKKVNFIDEWKKVPSQVGQVRCPFIKGEPKDLTANQDRVQSILSRSQEFQVSISKVPFQDLNIGEKGTIDVGSPAIDRGYDAGLYTPYKTWVEGANPANADGEIDTVEAWFSTAAVGNLVKYGTFEDLGSNELKCHDAEEYGEVSAGSKQTCTGLSIDITTGEYIGADARAASDLKLEVDISGGTGSWYLAGQYCDPNDQGTFSWVGSYILSLYGTGTEAGGVTHYGAATLTGVGTLAGIGQGIFIGKATLTGEGTLATIGSFLRYAKATLSGTGTLSSIGSFLRYGKASLSGTGTLATIGRGIFAGKATLSGVGTLTASAVVEGEGVNVTPTPVSAIGQIVAPTVLIASTIASGVENSEATAFNSGRKVARAADGSLHAVWADFRGTDYQIYYAKSTDDGKTWQETALTSGSYDQKHPSIAIDSNDHIHVVWWGSHVGFPSYEQIRYRKYTTSWQTIENLTSGDYDQSTPSIAIDGNDCLHVAWQGTHAASPTVYQIRYVKSSSWGDIANLTLESYHQLSPSIAIDGNNYIHITWYGRHTGSTTRNQIRYIKYTTSWQNIENLTSGDYSQIAPCIAIDGNDYIHIVWYGYHSGGGGRQQIRYIKYTTSWGSVENLTAENDHQDEPSIAIDGNNYVHIVWWGLHPGSDYYEQIRHIKYTTSWGSIQNLTSSAETQWYPALVGTIYPVFAGKHLNIAVNGFAFIWTDNTGTDSVRYYASGDLQWEDIYCLPEPVSAIASVIAPSVLAGIIIITPSFVSAIAQIVQPNVIRGNIIFSPAVIDAIAKAVNPTVIYSPIIPDPISAIAGVLNPVVVLSSISITPTYIEAIGQVVAPIVSIAGVLYVTPTPVDAIGGRVNPTVILGSITITPSVLSTIAQVLIGNVQQGNIIFSPAFIKVLGKVVAPTVLGGSVILEPESIEAIARGENPEVILASMTVTPEFVKALAGVISPTVLQTWIGRKLRIKIVTSQYRKLDVVTSQKRRLDVVTTQKRKIKILTSGG